MSKYLTEYTKQNIRKLIERNKKMQQEVLEEDQIEVYDQFIGLVNNQTTELEIAKGGVNLVNQNGEDVIVLLNRHYAKENDHLLATFKIGKNIYGRFIDGKNSNFLQFFTPGKKNEYVQIYSCMSNGSGLYVSNSEKYYSEFSQGKQASVVGKTMESIKQRMDEVAIGLKVGYHEKIICDSVFNRHRSEIEMDK